MEITELSRHRVVLKLPAFPRAATQATLIFVQPRTSKVPYKEWKWTFNSSNFKQKFEIPVKLIPGQRYFAEVIYSKPKKEKVEDINYEAKEEPINLESTKPEINKNSEAKEQESEKLKDQHKVMKLRMQLRAELSIAELEQLQSMAYVFLARKPLMYFTCHYFYRNKPVVYWQYVMRTCRGIMYVYPKSYGGDPGSPLSGMLNGLFFGACVDGETGYPRLTSHFGPQRFHLPAITTLVHPHGANLYFADFYCINKAHYVTLVHTLTDSPADIFCAKRLPKVNIFNNPFLFVDTRTRPLQVKVTGNVWIEVLITENINVAHRIYRDCFFRFVYSTGVSSLKGLPKNPECSHCNLPDLSPIREP